MDRSSGIDQPSRPLWRDVPKSRVEEAVDRQVKMAIRTLNPEQLESCSTDWSGQSGSASPKSLDDQRPRFSSANQDLQWQPNSRRIDSIYIKDDAKVHIGDSIVNQYNGKDPVQDLYDRALKLLAFPTMNERMRNVGAALPDTCEWFLRHSIFNFWCDDGKLVEHHGFLWLKGKPGSGKSTIMKETLIWTQKAWPDQTIIAYFFNARSPDALSKSSLGLYRTLAHQLIRHVPEALDIYMQVFDQSESRDGPAKYQSKELQNLLMEIFVRCSISRTTLFIDALDEDADDDDVRDMIGFLEILTARVFKAGRVLRVCLSSRHYPHITIRTSLSMILEHQPDHVTDIETYIHSKLLCGTEASTEIVRRKILEKAGGIFLWVVLVTAMLNRAFDQGKTTKFMLQKLESIPSDLNDVFTQILFRDLEDAEETVTLFRWIMFAKTPLHPLLLYQAVQFTCHDDMVLDPVDSGVIGRYIINCSHGLVEITRAGRVQVQFIHETVREYLKSNSELGNIISGQNGRMTFDPNACHARIAEFCLQYTIKSEQQITRDVISKDLRRYSAEFWLLHLHEKRDICSPTVLDNLYRVLVYHRHLMIWLQDTVLYDLPRQISPFHFAALTGRGDVLAYLINKCHESKLLDGIGIALNAAMNRGYTELGSKLIDLLGAMRSQGRDSNLYNEKIISLASVITVMNQPSHSI